MKCPLQNFRLKTADRRPKITPARSVRLDLKSAAILRECLDHFGGHGDVRRFFRILAYYFQSSIRRLSTQSKSAENCELSSMLTRHYGALSFVETAAGGLLKSNSSQNVTRDLAPRPASGEYSDRQPGLCVFGFDAIAQFAQCLETARLAGARAFAARRAADTRRCPSTPAPTRIARLFRRCRRTVPAAAPPCRRFGTMPPRPLTVMMRLQDSSGSGLGVHGEAQFLQAFDHDLRVLAPQRAGQGVSPSASAASISARLVMLLSRAR